MYKINIIIWFRRIVVLKDLEMGNKIDNLEFNLSDGIIKSLVKKNYEKLTDVQKKVIPLILDGKNLIAQSSTGTGKTAAFGIPIIERIFSNKNKNVNSQALIITPTRELASQVREEIRSISYFSNIRSIAVYGGRSIEKQIFILKKGIDIIIGTPGRITDLLKRKSLSVKNLDFFVLDEADEMIKKGFLDDVKWIMNNLEIKKSGKVQILLFSATFSDEVNLFCKEFLSDPVSILKKDFDNTLVNNPSIEQFYLEVSNFREKREKLLKIISENKFSSAVIFVNTKIEVERLCSLVRSKGIYIDYIHSGLPQGKRNMVLDKFRKGLIKILVSTDVFARGIDVSGITHVINYDFPQSDDFYIHRIGRTGRAGKSGVSITIILKKEKFRLMSLIKENNYKIKKID